MNPKTYKFNAIIKKVTNINGAYIEIPFDVKKEFGKSRVPVHATFNGENYDGSIVSMGTPNHIIGIRKSIREKIKKQPGDTISVTIKERITGKDNAITENKVFTGVREKWKPLYDKFLTLAQKSLDPFVEENTTNSILWRHNTSFSEIKAKQKALIITFPSNTLHPEWNPTKTTQTSKYRISHTLEITDESNFLSLIFYINGAYKLTYTENVTNRSPKSNYQTVDEYIASFPEEIATILKQFRKTILNSAKDATEKISWQMPTYFLHENLIHFAPAKKHISIFPTPDAIIAFSDKLTGYTTTKGSILFPISKPIDYDLIAEITKWRVKQVLGKFNPTKK